MIAEAFLVREHLFMVHRVLSVTEAEFAAGVMVVQNMMYMYQLLALLELKVELSMLLEMDNSGAVDIANRWSVSGRTHHMDVRNYFLHKLKDQGLLTVKHISGNDNDSDIFTKNVTAAVFNHHMLHYTGYDEYIQVQE
jgi:hypothetical protein